MATVGVLRTQKLRPTPPAENPELSNVHSFKTGVGLDINNLVCVDRCQQSYIYLPSHLIQFHFFFVLKKFSQPYVTRTIHNIESDFKCDLCMDCFLAPRILGGAEVDRNTYIVGRYRTQWWSPTTPLCPCTSWWRTRTRPSASTMKPSTTSASGPCG